MKKTNIHKLVFAAVLVALAVVGSLVSFPIGASKCAPVQHLVNIIGAVFLGPAWAVGVGFTAALLRIFWDLALSLRSRAQWLAHSLQVCFIST